jgi:hypothetical protein
MHAALALPRLRRGTKAAVCVEGKLWSTTDNKSRSNESFGPIGSTIMKDQSSPPIKLIQIAVSKVEIHLSIFHLHLWGSDETRIQEPNTLVCTAIASL